MRAIRILTILCALVPMVAVAQDRHPKRVVIARKMPAPWDVVAPGVLRQDLFDRRNPEQSAPRLSAAARPARPVLISKRP